MAVQSPRNRTLILSFHMHERKVAEICKRLDESIKHVRNYYLTVETNNDDVPINDRNCNLAMLISSNGARSNSCMNSLPDNSRLCIGLQLYFLSLNSR